MQGAYAVKTGIAVLYVSLLACNGGIGGEEDTGEDQETPADTLEDEVQAEPLEDPQEDPQEDPRIDEVLTDLVTDTPPDESPDVDMDTPADIEPEDGVDMDEADGIDVVDIVEVEIDCELGCSGLGDRYCTAGGYIECVGGPDCNAWVEFACPSGQTCSDFPTPTECKSICDDDCFPDTGWGRCYGNVYLQCGHFDSDSCNDFAVQDICLPEELCYSGDIGCVECLDECSSDGYQYCPSNRDLWVCGDFDSDSCLEWDERTCGEEETCDSDVNDCVCMDVCSVPGLRICDGYYGTMLCDDHDVDGCLEWGDFQTCPGAETCDGGVCSSSCTDDCSYDGQHQCYTGARRRICGYWDTDPCLEWTPIEACSPGLICDSSAPPGDPCVECIDSTDCRPDFEVCRVRDCVPPPGECYQTSDSSLPSTVGSYLESTTDVTASGSMTRFNIFIGMSGLWDMVDGDIDLRIWAPSGTFVLIDCPALMAADVFWDVLSSDTTPELASFIGEDPSGTWRLGILGCSGPSNASLETWAICPEM